MFKRKIIGQFITWKRRKNKSALLVMGARQVGKTTSVREFGKTQYRNLVEINFEKTPSARRAFDGDLDAGTVMLNLSAQGFGPFVPGETLVFFDEIQSCPNARTAIKFLVEDGRFDYVETGSLLGINYKDVSSYPVGFEEQVLMHPLDFEEFLWANRIAGDVIEVLADSYRGLRAVPEFVHEKIYDLFRRFLVCGGMPAAVSAFLGNDDFGETLRVQNMILGSYRDDASKYAGKDKDKVKAILDAIPEQLAKPNKRFHLAALEKGASTRKYEQATNWLADAGIALHCFNVSNLELPLSFSQKRNLYKLYLLDTGLLCAMAMNGIQSALLAGNIKINEGMVAENAVAAELSKKRIPLYYYDKKTRAELDFVFNDGGALSLIEVKSGNNYRRHPSLSALVADNPALFKKTIVFCKGNVESSGGIVYLPFYLAMFM
jgi:predicted AAA+ superfamily ATPase